MAKVFSQKFYHDFAGIGIALHEGMSLDERVSSAPIGLDGFEDYGLEQAGIEERKGCFGEIIDKVVFVLVAAGFKSSGEELDSLG